MRTTVAILLVVTTAMTAASVSPRQNFKFTPAKSNRTESATAVFDAAAPSGAVVLNITTSFGSPPDGGLLRVGVFGSTLSEIDTVDLKGIDNAGMDLELSRLSIDEKHSAAYEDVSGELIKMERDPGIIPLLRGMAVLNVYGRSLMPGSNAPRPTRQPFRLPLPPVIWTLQTVRGPLDFRLTKTGQTEVMASLVMTGTAPR